MMQKGENKMDFSSLDQARHQRKVTGQEMRAIAFSMKERAKNKLNLKIQKEAHKRQIRVQMLCWRIQKLNIWHKEYLDQFEANLLRDTSELEEWEACLKE